MFNLNIIFMIIVFILGFLCLLRSRNMVRMIIGTELMARASTFGLIYFGYMQNNTAVAQALVITVIVIEVVVSATALAVIINLFKFSGSLDVRNLNKLKG